MHGDNLVGKADGNIRFYFENVDGFVVPTNKNSKKTKYNNNKQTYLSNLFSRPEVDIFGGVETRQQYDMLPSNLKLSKQLDLREGSRTQTSHNVHERFSTVQQGGTCILAQEAIGSFVSEQGSDAEGLGRLSWLKLSGKSITTRIVVDYMPCTTRKQAVYVTLAQQRRYWKLQGNK